jgi:hypothetical protein
MATAVDTSQQGRMTLERMAHNDARQRADLHRRRGERCAPQQGSKVTVTVACLPPPCLAFTTSL